MSRPCRRLIPFTTIRYLAKQSRGLTLDASYWAPAEYTQAVQAIVQTVDNLIDLDFQYTDDYRQADYAAYVYDYQFDGIAGSHTDTGWWGLTEIFYNPYETWQSNVNTFVHEFGHYLGLGEPGFDWRFN